jgi:hypothetical protein
MYELLHLLLYVAGGVVAMLLIGFFLYYAGRLVTMGVMRSIQDAHRRT